MKNHFIKNIAIENFKCFQQLQIDGMEIVNLIGGKNNVGKTAFLEAVELLVSSNKPYDLAINIYNLLTRRQNPGSSTNPTLDLFREDESKIKISTENKMCEIYLIIQEEDLFSEETKFNQEIENIIPTVLLSLAINGYEKAFPVERLLTPGRMFFLKERALKKALKNVVNFIGSAKIEEREIAILYSSLVDLDREDFLNESLRKFDENLISIKQKVTKNEVILKVKLKNKQTPVLLSSLGEGINRYITILCAIWASKDGFLLIDEVENGIDHTNYKKLWRIIFQASAEANCQLFVTSHSKECITAFNEVLLENDKNSGVYFEFYENLKTDITASIKKIHC